MPAVDLDRQTIERRDFPIGRRGYDAAAVDAHLRSLAVAIEELREAAASGGVGAGQSSLATAAGLQVQGILEAAEQTAADIERRAQEGARELRAAAARDAEQIRDEAIEKARAHVTGVAQVTATLLERVGGMDAEAHALVDSLRAGAGRLANDLASVESNMAELYDASSGRATAPPGHEPAHPPPGEAEQAPQQDPLTYAPPRAAAPIGQARPEPSPFAAELAGAMAATPPLQPAPEPAAPEPVPAQGAEPAAAGQGDVDGARLVALNMALNGESRADTERYLAENFQLPDRTRLVEEVYAAIEG